MATLWLPIVNGAMKPDTTGNAIAEPSNLSGGLGSNNLYNRMLLAFKSQSAKHGLWGAFRVPKNYVGTAAVTGKWMTTATAGDVVFFFEYRSIADAESGDPSTDQEATTVTKTAAGTARLESAFSIALTSANLAADDVVLFYFGRNGAAAGDTLAATAWVEAGDLGFQYADA